MERICADRLLCRPIAVIVSAFRRNLCANCMTAPHMDLLRGTTSSVHRDCATSCATSSPAAPTATTTTTTTAAVTAAMAAAAATRTATAAATAPMAATATENDDVFNFHDARTGVHQIGITSPHTYPLRAQWPIRSK